MSIRGGLVTVPGVSKHEMAGLQPLILQGGDSLVLPILWGGDSLVYIVLVVDYPKMVSNPVSILLPGYNAVFTRDV